MDKVIDIFPTSITDNIAAHLFLSYAGQNYMEEFIAVAKSLGYLLEQKIYAVSTATMRADTGIHQPPKQRKFASRVKSAYGRSFYWQLKNRSKMWLEKMYV